MTKKEKWEKRQKNWREDAIQHEGIIRLCMFMLALGVMQIFFWLACEWVRSDIEEKVKKVEKEVPVEYRKNVSIHDLMKEAPKDYKIGDSGSLRIVIKDKPIKVVAYYYEDFESYKLKTIESNIQWILGINYKVYFIEYLIVSWVVEIILFRCYVAVGFIVTETAIQLTSRNSRKRKKRST